MLVFSAVIEAFVMSSSVTLIQLRTVIGVKETLTLGQGLVKHRSHDIRLPETALLWLLLSSELHRGNGGFKPQDRLLLDEMEFPEGFLIPISRLQQPKIGAEVAFILAKYLDSPRLILTEVIQAMGYVAPAFEIVGSRIRNWNI